MAAKIVGLITAIIIVFTTSNTGVKITKNDEYDNYISQQISYVTELSEADGSVAMARPVYNSAYASLTPGAVDGIEPTEYLTWKSARVCPYFSSIAVIGMLEASPAYAKDVAERYIEWHFDHLNTSTTDYNGVDGTIYDYVVFVNSSGDKAVSVSMPELKGTNAGAYDSTDSYAALFLKLLYTYTKAYPNSDLVKNHETDIYRIVNALKSTYSEKVGLTYAKPDYAICYLMDNCEVYQGLVCASDMFSSYFKNSDKSSEYRILATNVKNGVEKYMYNAVAQAYYASVSPTGTKTSSVTDEALNVFYPAGTAQIFPILCGMYGQASSRAKRLYADFNERFGTDTGWQTLGIQDAFPWALILKVATIMGDNERVAVYIDSLDTKFFSKNNPYPYYCAESGHVLSSLATIQQVGLKADASNTDETETTAREKISQTLTALIQMLMNLF